MIQVPDNESFVAKLDGKGRITVPKNVREQWGVSGGDTLEVAVVGTEKGYECDECGTTHPLPNVLILDEGERIVCANCATVDDRIV